MKKIDLGQTITILANVGVIAGIVFLAIELQQNNALLETEIRSIRHSIREADFLRPLQYPELARTLIKHQRGESLTEYDTLILNRSMPATLYNYQLVFTEYAQGRIEESSLNLDDWRSSFDGQSKDYWPDLREYWESNKRLDYDPEFVRWMDDNVVNVNE